MERAFGVKKEKEPASSVQDASDRITRRGDTIDEKIKKLDTELGKYKEQIKRMRPGPVQEAKKARAMRILQQKRTYEGQRDMLCNESFRLDQVAFNAEGIKDKDAQQTLTSLKYANKDLKGVVKIMKIHGIDIQETFGVSYNVPDDFDEEELLVELNCLEAGMGMETETREDLYFFNWMRGRFWVQSLTCLKRQHPAGHAAEPSGRSNAQADMNWVCLPVLMQKELPSFLVDHVLVPRK